MNAGKKIFFVFTSFLMVGFTSLAQLKVLQKPSFSSTPEMFANAVVAMPELNLETEKKSATGELNGKLTFAKAFDVNFTPQNSGVYTVMPNGNKIWLLKISSQIAFSLNIIFEKFHLPPGAELWLYNADKTYALGAYTALNNSKSGKLAIEPVPGSELLLEYFEPAGVPFAGELLISKVNHDFLDVFKALRGFGDSDVCNVDINCDAGNEWQMQKRAVLKTMINGKDLCSGALINNSLQNGTPYFYTASHCGDTQTDAENWIFYFQYERPFCNSGTPPIKTLSGSDLIATSGNLDFTLVKLKDIPPPDFNPFYAGWDATGNTPNYSVTIHHPSGDVKKISRDNDPPQTTTYPDNSYDSNVHWHIAKWDVGTTEGGSSGAPLFDQNKRIIGDLTGGEASCTKSVNDYFQKFAVAWKISEIPDRQLKHWLDPNNSGALVLDGFDPYAVNRQFDANLFRIIVPSDTIEPGNYIPEIMVYNNGSTTITSLKIAYKLNAEPAKILDWTGELLKHNSTVIKLPEVILTAGNFTFEITLTEVNAQSDEFTDNNLGVINGYARKDYDIKIYSTDMPKTLCASNLFPSVNFVNIGKNDLSSVSIRMSVNNTNEISSFWSGTLTKGSSLRLNFPEFEAATDTTKLTFWAERINGIDIPATDYIYFNYQVVKAVNRLKYFMKTDNWPNEISWKFVSKSNGTIAQSQTYSSGSAVTVNEHICFADTAIYFEIADELNDGMCCEHGAGYLYIENSATGDVLFTGGEFTNNRQATLIFPKHEVEISTVILPGVGTEPGIFEPTIRVRNLGTEPIKELNAKASYNNTTLNATFSGNLNRYDTTDISFAPINFQQGKHTLDFWVETPNAKDFELKNNALNYSVYANSGSNLELSIKTDFRTNENSWQLADDAGNILAEADSLRANKLYVHNFWLPYGCYKLAFTDTAANSLCCDFGNGFLKLLNKENNELIVDHTFFTAKTGTKNFCLTNAIETDKISKWQVFPNPASKQLFIENLEVNEMHIKIFDLTGKLLYSEVINQSKTEIDISSFSSGMYRMQIVSDKFVEYNKLIIKE